MRIKNLRPFVTDSTSVPAGTVVEWCDDEEAARMIEAGLVVAAPDEMLTLATAAQRPNTKGEKRASNKPAH